MNKIGTVVFVAVSGLVGGITGYLIADLLIYKMISDDIEEIDYELGEVTNIERNEDGLTIEIKPTTKNDLNLKKLALSQKVPLQDLVRDYKPEPVNRIVPYEEVLRSKLGYELEQVSFYEKDNVYATDDGEIIPDPASFLGQTLPLLFGVSDGDDPDTTFIRDDNREVYYQVTLYHGSYDSLVLGIPEEAEEKSKKPRKKKVVTEEDDGE